MNVFVEGTSEFLGPFFPLGLLCVQLFVGFFAAVRKCLFEFFLWRRPPRGGGTRPQPERAVVFFCSFYYGRISQASEVRGKAVKRQLKQAI